MTDTPTEAYAHGLRLTAYGLRIAFLYLLALLLLAGCSAFGAEEEFAVEIAGDRYRYHFEPPTLVVPVGASVSWKNAGVVPQMIVYSPEVQLEETSAEPPIAEGWDSGLIYPGEHWSRTFTTPGVYAYFNRMSDNENLFGFVVVEE